MQKISGRDKFQKKALQKLEYLREIYGDISIDETNNWNPMSDNPTIKESQQEPIDINHVEKQGEDEEVDMIHEWSYIDDEVNTIPPWVVIPIFSLYPSAMILVFSLYPWVVIPNFSIYPYVYLHIYIYACQQ